MTPLLDRSTRLLFRFVRVRLAVGMLAAFLSFALVFPWLEPSRSPQGTNYASWLLGFGLTAAWVMGLHRRLGETMFPVTDRQVAWIPMATWALATTAGTVGLLASQIVAVLCGTTLDDLAGNWLATARMLPRDLLVLLLLWRTVRMNSRLVFGWFIGAMALLALFDNSGMGREWAAAMSPWWPMMAALCVFLVWEAPRQTAMLRRLDWQVAIKGDPNAEMRFPEKGAPVTRPHWASRSMDALLGLALAGVAVFFLVPPFVRVFSAARLLQALAPSEWWVLALVLWCLGSWAKAGWLRNRASGMGPLRASVVLLLEATVVGFFFRDLMGVARGSVERCKRCGGWRLVWQAGCPACGGGPSPARSDAGREAGASAGSLTASGQWRTSLRARLFPSYDPMAQMFRFTISFLLVVLYTMARRH